MARRGGRTFKDWCGECGKEFESTNILGAQNQAQSCYDKHFANTDRDLEVVLKEIKDRIGEW